MSYMTLAAGDTLRVETEMGEISGIIIGFCLVEGVIRVVLDVGGQRLSIGGHQMKTVGITYGTPRP